MRRTTAAATHAGECVRCSTHTASARPNIQSPIPETAELPASSRYPGLRRSTVHADGFVSLMLRRYEDAGIVSVSTRTLWTCEFERISRRVRDTLRLQTHREPSGSVQRSTHVSHSFLHPAQGPRRLRPPRTAVGHLSPRTEGRRVASRTAVGHLSPRTAGSAAS